MSTVPSTAASSKSTSKFTTTTTKTVVSMYNIRVEVYFESRLRLNFDLAFFFFKKKAVRFVEHTHAAFLTRINFLLER